MNTSGKVPAVLKGIIVMIVSRGKEPLLLRVRFGSQNWPWSRGDVSSELLMLRMTHPWQEIGKEVYLFYFILFLCSRNTKFYYY